MHCMIDLETWGLHPGCAIRSIGAVMFDPYTPARRDTFYRNVAKKSCIDWGLTIDPKTEAWWSTQSSEAKAVLETNQFGLMQSLFDLSDFVKDNKAEGVWSHGSGADIVWLEAAYRLTKIEVPWHYKAPRDTRTLFWAANLDVDSLPRVGTHHNALDDAMSQASAVQIAMNRLRF